ncbi:hypothetical protein PR048_028409 [Dryococelus australis]|uniref:HAT C-terminal dimerisation domain-containing protein n=1 Tax=Dryococelus australis TaxID=614101 RepID=A0ABQ9GAG5_9NEOP|nr:hypothetical protein PR048_028409 [Dryococelus australis]
MQLWEQNTRPSLQKTPLPRSKFTWSCYTKKTMIELQLVAQKKKLPKRIIISGYTTERLSLPRICMKLQANPLEKWEEFNTAFPLLYKRERMYLHIVATSVPCERLFSKIGATITTSINHLTGKP